MLGIALFVIVLCVYKHTQAGTSSYAQCQSQAQTRCDCRNFEKPFFVREDLQTWVSSLPAICVGKLWVGQVCKDFLLDYENKSSFPSLNAWKTTSRIIAQFSLMWWLKYSGKKSPNSETLQHQAQLLPLNWDRAVRAVPTQLWTHLERANIWVQGRKEMPSPMPRHFCSRHTHAVFRALLTADFKPSFSDKNFQLFAIFSNFQSIRLIFFSLSTWIRLILCLKNIPT